MKRGAVEHSPVSISVGANREGRVILTLVHLRKDAMSISTYMKDAATLDGSDGSVLPV